jgi:hypothetical protein
LRRNRDRFKAAILVVRGVRWQALNNAPIGRQKQIEPAYISSKSFFLKP